MKKFISTLLLTLLCTLLPGCKSLKKIEPGKALSGAQLVLAKANSGRRSLHHSASGKKDGPQHAGK